MSQLLTDAELRTPPPSLHIMVMSATRRFTVDDLDLLPDDGNRYEVLHGMLLVTPSPGVPHQTVAANLLVSLANGLRDEANIQCWSPGVVRIGTDTHLEPDILVGSPPANGAWDGIENLWLAVEVSGAGSRVYDREYKRDGYLEAGVAEVWLVDLYSRTILVSKQRGPKDIEHASTLIWRSPGGRRIGIDVPGLLGAITDDR